MSLLETLQTALESLSSNKMRTMLTMLGVVIGVAAVVTLLALGAGVQSSINSQISGIGTNLVNVSANTNASSGARLTNDDVKALSDRLNVPDAQRVVAQLSGNMKVAAGTNSDSVSVIGTTPDYFVVQNTKVAQGASFTQDDVDNRVRVAVLGPTLAETLFPSGSALGQTFLAGTVPFRVVGILEVKGSTGFGSTDDSVFVPLTVAQEKLFVNRSAGLKSVSQIVVEAVSSDRTDAVVTQVTQTLRERHNLLSDQADDFRIFNQASLISTLNTVTATLTAFLGAIGAISLLVGGIGIMNIMLVSVTERTREIGVRKAIGAQPMAIRIQFLIEALVVTVTAGVTGILFSITLVALINQLQLGITAVVQLSAVLIAFVVSVLIGVVFGFYPAWRASRLEPVEALRYE
ncbi:MAG: ABC transporter permease [Chloroflexi bacterium]|nr:ABC transporter permease [Chloroflexota bacterium]